MKKSLLLILLSLLLLLPAFADGADWRIMEITGKTWMSWTVFQKEAWVVGFLTSHYSIMVAIKDNKLDVDPKYKEALDWLYLNASVGEIVYNIDKFFQSDSRYLSFPIWNAVYIIFGLSWWEKKEVTPETTKPIL